MSPFAPLHLCTSSVMELLVTEEVFLGDEIFALMMTVVAIALTLACQAQSTEVRFSGALTTPDNSRGGEPCLDVKCLD